MSYGVMLASEPSLFHSVSGMSFKFKSFLLSLWNNVTLSVFILLASTIMEALHAITKWSCFHILKNYLCICCGHSRHVKITSKDSTGWDKIKSLLHRLIFSLAFLIHLPLCKIARVWWEWQCESNDNVGTVNTLIVNEWTQNNTGFNRTLDIAIIITK